MAVQEDRSEYCVICRSTQTLDFLECASREFDDTDLKSARGTAPRELDFGTIGDVIQRGRSCPLCQMILLVLKLGAVMEMLAGMERVVVENCGCQLIRRDHQYRHDQYRGYHNIDIEIGIHKSSPFSVGRYQIEDAFHITNQPPLAPDSEIWQCDRIGNGIAPITRLLPDMCNSNLIRQWLSICESTHGGNCRPRLDQRLSTIRLVDTRAKCIKSFVQTSDLGIPRYIALSYVWGPTLSSYTLLAKDLEHVHNIGFLDYQRLPATILDAISLVSNIGERYIWVDRLCIVQDDDKDKMRYIPMMGSIYAEAIFTIIAAAGADSDAGLPGLRPGTRQSRQHSILINTMCITSCVEPVFDPGALLSDYVWKSRAWTFQEKMLSAKCIIFNSKQVYWECLTASFLEETAFEFLPQGTTPRQMPSMFSWDLVRHGREVPNFYKTFNTRFVQMVESFNVRSLSIQSDMLKAIEGSLQVLTDRTGVSFLWGHPNLMFERHLLWPMQDNTIETKSVQGFPTWSWPSYPKCLLIRTHILTYKATIQCFVVSRESNQGKNAEYSLQRVYQNPHDSTHDMAYEPDVQNASFEDVPLSIRNYIIPGFHLVFFADTLEIDSKRLKPDGRYLNIYAPNDPSAAKIENQVDEHYFGSPKGHRFIGRVAYRPQPRDELKTSSYYIVKIITPALTRRDILQIYGILVTFNAEGIAERVGDAYTLPSLLKQYTWTQKLIVLG